MNKTDVLTKELTKFLNDHFNNRDHFACIYGSHASGHSTLKSDFDIVVAFDLPTDQDYKNILNFLIKLHTDNNLPLDNEVPYSNKIVVSYQDFEYATNLKGIKKENELYQVPSIKKTTLFLSSLEMRWRLLFNILTSPHIIVSGNTKTYQLMRDKAEQALVSLAINLTQKRNPTISELLDRLLQGKYGEEGELYLGYKNRDTVIEHLEKIISSRYRNVS